MGKGRAGARPPSLVAAKFGPTDVTWTGLKPVREKSSRIIRVRLRTSSYEEEERRMTGYRRKASANLLLAGFVTAVSFDGMSRSIRKVSSLTSNDTYERASVREI